MLRLFTTSAVQAAAFPFTRVYRGIRRIVWNDRVHRSVEGDEISDMAVDKNISELMADGIAEIQHRAPLHPGKDIDHLTGYGLDRMGKILWTYHFYRDGLMKKWKFTEKENKGAPEASGRDGGNESGSGEPS